MSEPCSDRCYVVKILPTCGYHTNALTETFSHTIWEYTSQHKEEERFNEYAQSRILVPFLGFINICFVTMSLAWMNLFTSLVLHFSDRKVSTGQFLDSEFPRLRI